MNIEIFGGGERSLAAGRIFSKSDIDIENVKIFPIPTTKDGITVMGKERLLFDTVAGFERGDFVVAYGLPQEIKKLLDEKGVLYYDGAADEDFLVENARITAEGTLSFILGTMPKIPRDTSFGIIGYGRIGSALFRLLSFFGARVCIFSRKKLTRIELGSVGIDSFEIVTDELTKDAFCDIEMLFNTAPTDLSGLFPEKILPPGLRVVDLASGDSFPGVAGVEYLPSVPGRMYPVSAGESYARFAIRSLLKKK